ncbi:MAG: hypothetical protein R2877_05350 [Bdellovibrionota bacterium]
MARASNNATVVWSEMIGGGVQKVFASEYDGSTWIPPSSTSDFIEPAFASNMTEPDVAMSDNGQRTAIMWSNTSNRYVTTKNLDSGT